MSKFFIEDSDLVRVNFKGGEWADIKAEMTQEDKDAIMNAMAKATAGTDTCLQISLGKMALLERSVVAWSFGVPVNKENISRLRNKYRSVLLAEIDKVNSAVDEFSKN